jgi:cholesterol transport system auxiliary component
MKILRSIPAILSVLLLAVLQSACASRASAPALYDFGPLGTSNNPADVRLPALNVAEVQTPAWLDGPMMFYRLNYANIQQAYPYAGSRWSMTPAQLLGQRLKARIAQAGGTVLSPQDGVAQLPVLKVDADEFIQIFSTPNASTSVLNARASLFQGSHLIGQRQFSQQINAPTPDAAGGARAMANASDALIGDMLHWIAEIKLPSSTNPAVK